MHRIADKILIEEFEVETIIGVYEYERVQNQTLVISMTLHTCFSKVEESDDIEDTLDYTWICDEIKTIATETKSFTLEALGTKLAQWALSLKFVEKVVVKLNKRGAVTNAKSIGIEVVREKEEILKEDTFERSDQYYDNEVNETNEECLLPSDSPSSTKSSDVLCYLALGSNIGRRAWYIEKAIEMLRALVGKVNRIAFLYEFPPAYDTNQPFFLNTALSIYTSMSPVDLIETVKYIEKVVGRMPSRKNGPREIDIDLLFYGDSQIQTAVLTVPHPMCHERNFVLRPMMDIAPDFRHPILKKKIRDLWNDLKCKGDHVQVIPVRRAKVEKVIKFGPTSPSLVMGIVNATPDSFCDGGLYNIDQIGENVKNMCKDCKDIIIDIGGESTRPNAHPVSDTEESSRVSQALEVVRKSTLRSFPPYISLDTYKHTVVSNALPYVDIVNDVLATSKSQDSPDEFDAMAALIAKHGLSWVIMHSRGNPQTMTKLADYQVGKVLETVCSELSVAVNRALSAGILPWHIIIDPGLGFAKTGSQNLEILLNLKHIKKQLGNFPVLIGPSNKSFIGEIINQPDPMKRNYGTLAAIVQGVIKGAADIVRVHDIRMAVDGLKVADKIKKMKNAQVVNDQ